MQRAADVAQAGADRAGCRTPQACRGKLRDPIMPPGAQCTNRRPLCFLGGSVQKSSARPRQMAAAGNCRAARPDRDINPTCTQRTVYGV